MLIASEISDGNEVLSLRDFGRDGDSGVVEIGGWEEDLVKDEIRAIFELLESGFGGDGEVGFQFEISEIFVDEILPNFGDGAGGCTRSAIGFDFGFGREDDFARFVKDAFASDKENAEEYGEYNNDKSDNDGDDLSFEAGRLSRGV